MTQLAKQTGARFDIVNYKGTGPMVFDLMAGNIDIGAGSLAGLGPGIQKGSFRPVLVISGGRSEKLLPGIPTWADEGFTGAAFENLTECNMILGPAGLPADVVRRVADACRESASRSEAVRNVLAQLGVEEAPLTGAELQRFIQRTWPTYQAMTRELGLQAQ